MQYWYSRRIILNLIQSRCREQWLLMLIAPVFIEPVDKDLADMSDIIYLTRERMRELEQEIMRLKTHERKEIAQKIAEARSYGDLSENAEYDAAKEAQGLLEARIYKLEQTIA